MDPCIHTKHRIVHFKWVDHTVCELYLYEVVIMSTAPTLPSLSILCPLPFTCFPGAFCVSPGWPQHLHILLCGAMHPSPSSILGHFHQGDPHAGPWMEVARGLPCQNVPHSIAYREWDRQSPPCNDTISATAIITVMWINSPPSTLTQQG